MLKYVLAIVIILGVCWGVFFTGIISLFWLRIIGIVFIVFGFLFTFVLGSMMFDKFDTEWIWVVKTGVALLVIGMVLVLIEF